MDKKEIDVSIVFPTYNEAENIVPLIKRTQESLKDYQLEIIVVDDDSPDKTWELASLLNSPDVKVVRRINQRKLVGAIQKGIDLAKGKYVVWMDADQSMPPELVPKMIPYLDRYGVCVGSRYAKGGKDARPFLRVASSRFINLLANIVLNFKVLDYDSGFIAARKDVLENYRLSDSGYGEYCIDFLYRVGKKHRIKEVGYSFTDRRAGQSKTAATLFGLFKFGLIYMKRIFEIRLKY